MTIGIPGWLVGPNSFGVTLSYMTFMRQGLGVDDIRILSPDSPIYEDLDLLIIPGGADINPMRYGEIPSVYTDKPDLLKEYFDLYHLPRYIELNTPILGICRGMQTIAVHFGAKLYQDMWHDTNKSEDPTSSVHKLLVLNDTTLKVGVNSRHHQSVKYNKDNEFVIPLATHKDFRHHLEAIRIKDKKILGVQWHPEDLDDPSGMAYTMKSIQNILKIE